MCLNKKFSVHLHAFLRVVYTGVLLLILSGQIAKGQQVTGTEGISVPSIYGLPVLTGSTLVPGATNTITYSPAGEQSRDLLNVITLRLAEGTSTYFKSNFAANIELSLFLTNFDGSTVVEDGITLTVNYDSTTGAKYKVRDYITFQNYKSVQATIVNINITGVSGWDPTTVLVLDNEIRAIRYFNLSTNINSLTATVLGSQTAADVFLVNWAFPAGAFENKTQLEWAYVENEMLGYYGGDIEKIFKTNSTRVDLDYSSNGYSYKIPLLFAGAGKLFYRVRAAQQLKNGTLITGPWTVTAPTLNSFSFTGHQSNINWQSSTSYAEEGKSKTVVQYFDGSLRNRQIVTKDNSTGNTVVGETIYDLQGRPNLQILPTPTAGNILQFYPNFNKFNGMASNEDPAKYFDLTPAALKCNTPRSLDSSVGNGRYYSANNDWLNTENNAKYIPSAQGYAYTETRFTNDATQRVKLQGGVGLTHQIGQGHETKYFYGKPTQQELDALFGTDVGYENFYTKNMVQDANGQVSVSYVDMQGRTIATALAGDAFSGIEPVYTNTTDYPLTSSPIRNYLTTPTTNIVQGRSITSVGTIMAAVPTAFSFRYSFTPEILQLINCTGQNVCFDCKYDLEISIRPEECGNDVPIVKRYNNLQILPAANACTQAMLFTGTNISTPTAQISFDTTLPVGSYTIRKTLIINDSLFEQRKDSAIKVMLCKTRDSIYHQVFDSLVTITGCGISATTSCLQCKDSLGTYEQYKIKLLTSLFPVVPSEVDIRNQYISDSLNCSQICDTTGSTLNPLFNTLVNIRKAMLEDMIPFSGQYATDTLYNNSIATLDARYNIFTPQSNYNGVFYNTNKPFYKNPKTETGNLNYLDYDRLPDTTVMKVYDPVNYPGMRKLDTMGKASFTDIFNIDLWNTSLITYHPEYSKLVFAEQADKAAVFTWYDKVISCKTYANAILPENNFMNPLSSDPYWLLPNTAVDKDTLTMYLYSTIRYNDTVGPSIWQVANATVGCRLVDSTQKFACMKRMNKTGIDASANTPVKRDEVWDAFRTAYFGKRLNMSMRYINRNAPNALGRSEMNELITEGKQLHFAEFEDMANQSGSGGWWGQLNDPNNTILNPPPTPPAPDNCKAIRITWKAYLLQCEVLSARLKTKTTADSVWVNSIITQILDGMETICRNSQTPTQPYGASNVAPGNTSQPQNFEQVINGVFAANGITTVPENYFCNPYSIESPKPYGFNPPIATVYSSTLDSCACNRMRQLKLEAAASTAPVYDTTSRNSMNQFLWNNYRDSLSLVVWNGLQKCNLLYRDTCTYPPPQFSKEKSSKPTSQIFYADTASLKTTDIIADATNPCAAPQVVNVEAVQSSYLSINYTTITNCTISFKLLVYNAWGTLLGSVPIPCGSSSINTLGYLDLDVCNQTYQCKIQGYSKSCGGFINSNTYTYTPNCNPCPPAPQINSITTSSGYLVVNFTSTTSGYFNCLCNVRVFDANGIFVGEQPLQYCRQNQTNANTNIPNASSNLYSSSTVLNSLNLDTCKLYTIYILCNYPDCPPVQSNTATYTPNCNAAPCPPAPQINSVNATNWFNVIVNYNTASSCNGTCTLYVKNATTGSTIYSTPVNCSQNTIAINLGSSGDSCVNVNFNIICVPTGCPKSGSNIITVNRGCTVMCPKVLVPIQLEGTAVIPPFLSCAYVKPCISCSTLVNVHTVNFRNLYPAYSAVPYLDSTATPAQIAQNNLWARYLNYKTGFRQKASVYIQAYKSCIGGSQPTNALCAFSAPDNDPVDIVAPPDTCKETKTIAVSVTEQLMVLYKDSLLAKFDSLYLAKCLNAKYLESFYVEYVPKEYHFTLYYYNRAGNLVKTLPPAAVKPNFNPSYLQTVSSYRQNNSDVSYTNPNNNDALATLYRYNSLNQVVEQKTPDAGISRFWYDTLGRLVISQNAKQLLESKYSYTQYDALGRITQVGQKPHSQAMTQAIAQSPAALATWFTSGSVKEQITRTVYDQPYYDVNNVLLSSILSQSNLRNRVSYTQAIPQQASVGNEAYLGLHSQATYYSYDIHGNVDALLQDYNAPWNGNSNRYKKMVYKYDLISGKINQVQYQPGMTDQFTHRYGYDAENRLTFVETSTDSVYWEKEAAYTYYRHGPLSRTELGQNKVQGLDYAYTIQGWLKGVNGTAVNNGFDLGKDGWGNTGSLTQDAFGFSLNYFAGDYTPIGGTTANAFAPVPLTLPADPTDNKIMGAGLYNGNIRAMAVNIPKLAEDASLYAYRYDQLNRISGMSQYSGLQGYNNQFGSMQAQNTYRERVSYDPNGNIRTYLRNATTQGGQPLAMDNLNYNYNLSGTNLQNNRLRHVTDAVPSGNYSQDVDNQGVDNYSYDAIGNLTGDAAEGISSGSIQWNVYGKITGISKTNGTVIKYAYDAAGNRIMKVVNTDTTIYVRDASGNIMSLYNRSAATSNQWRQTELSLYGSSRLGVNNINRSSMGVDTISYHMYRNSMLRGNKAYELSNHLGNVLVTVSDKLLMNDFSCNRTGGSCYVFNFKADVLTATDYYPFGMQMPGRTFTQANTNYRYGFNGKELDKEASTTTTYDYGFRIYNPALARFLSVDPLTKNFPWWTPYQFAGNTPIQAIDLDGLEVFLPRVMPVPIEPILTMPRVPTMPIPGEIAVPPAVMNLPNNMTVGQLKSSPIDNAEEFDWSKVDRAKPETWPKPPFSGDSRIGEPSKKKPRERGEKSLYDDENGEWRPHVPDDYHPEGHWDYKPPGENTQWQNIYLKTLPPVIITSPPKQKNFFEKIWNGIKEFFTPDPPKQDESFFYNLT